MKIHPTRITAALDAAKLWGPEVDIQLGGRGPARLIGMACMRGGRRALRIYETPPRVEGGLLG